jgi:hypothetical protein
MPDRFEAKFKRGGDDECWPWIAYCNKAGYGRFRLNGEQRFAHRVAAWRAGIINNESDSIVVRHKCDNPRCVNPAHLEAGTQADNVKDRVARGRSQRGESHAKAKLTERKVRQIKEMLRAKIQHKYIALMYGVTVQAVSAIKTERAWRHVK